MKYISLKYTSLFLLLILLFYLINPFYYIYEPEIKVEASIRKEQVLTGLGIAFLLFLLSKVGETVIPDNSTIRPSNISQAELDLLARLIYAESRGEPYTGQVAVGAVVLNRVKSPEFPNNIRDVIYQRNQFAVVNDGQINLTPNQTAYRAAREALNGSDPSLGAIYFYNPRTAKTISWLETRKTTVVIENHVFAINP